MKKLVMYRLQLANCSIGSLIFPGTLLHTIEKPWVPYAEGKAGTPFESCVPYGVYELTPHSSSKYKDVIALVNHNLGVYHYPHECKNPGDRYAILIHTANWAKDVVGCIGPGLGANYDLATNEHMVAHSSSAMKIFKTLVKEYTHLEIKPYE